jgi:hypothetical protein
LNCTKLRELNPRGRGCPADAESNWEIKKMVMDERYFELNAIEYE